MLMDEIDYSVFQNLAEKEIFNEIITSYYSKNYRSAIVSLYSLVIFDLYQKLNTLEEMGNKNAKQNLVEIRKNIENNAHYSDIEKAIISFFKNNYSNYFSCFCDDIDYLTNMRHKCAHLFLNDNQLYIPSQSQTKMLIEKMYDCLFRVQAPFIDDIFNVVKDEVGNYNNKIRIYLNDYKDIHDKLNLKYFIKMTDSSISKSLKTLFRLVFVSDNEDAKLNRDGLFIFLHSLMTFSCEKNKKQCFIDANFQAYIKNNIDSDLIDDSRIKYLTILGNEIPEIRKMYRHNIKLFNKIIEYVKKNSRHFLLYIDLFDNGELLNTFNNNLIGETYDSDYEQLYTVFVGGGLISSSDFFIRVFKNIPTFNGFSTTDVISEFFLSKIDEINNESIKEILSIYNGNPQCYGRQGNSQFKAKISKLKEKYYDIDFTLYKHIF